MSVLITFIKLIAVFDLLVIAVYFGGDILSTMLNKLRRKAKQEDIPAIAEVIREVWEQMEEKSWFVADDENWIRQILESGSGMAYLAETAAETEAGTDEKAAEKVFCERCFDEKTLAGVFLVAFPGDRSEHLGNDLDMTEEEKQLSAHR